MPGFEEAVLDAVAARPSTSTRAIAHDLECSHSSVWRVLHDDGLHPFRLQRVQALLPTDYPLRVDYCQWYLQKIEDDQIWDSYVMHSDEANFSEDGMFNNNNSHIYAHENPHATYVHGRQQRFSVNVWAGVVGDCLLGPYMLPPRLNGDNYLAFLQQMLPELLEDVPLDIRRNMWFQHDGAPAHFTLAVREYLTATYGDRWIGRGGPRAWPPRSPDLTPLDFAVWGHLKSLVYETPVQNEMDLIARIVAAADNLRTMPGVFQRMRISGRRRCGICIDHGGRNFEQFL